MRPGILITIAWRNLWRHTRRTLLTAVTVALGLTLLMINFGLGDGGHAQMIDSAVRMCSGHVVIQADGYQKQGGIERALGPDQLQRIEGVLKSEGADFPIQSVVRRVFGSGLASSADGSAGVQIIGIQPSLEAQSSIYPEKVAKGEFLVDGDQDEVLIGQGIARKLKLEVGDKLVFMAQAAGTSDIQSRLAHVKGILATGQEEFDQVLVLAPLSYCQDFFHLPGQAHQVAVLMDDHRPSDSLRDALSARLAKDVEVLSWDQALPELRDFIRVDDGGNYVGNLFLYVLIGFMVLNTLLMSVLERRREFSLLDALGLPAADRFVMVLIEAGFIAALSCVLGLALGYSAHLYFKIHGLPLDIFYSGELTAAGVAMDPILYSSLSAGRIVMAISVTFGMALLLALFPALRAARRGSVKILGSA